MRRRLEAYIPLVMLALLVQLFAPIGAFRAVAEAASDPLYMSAICSGMASQDDPASTQLPPSHDTCCSFCAGVLAGSVAIDPPVHGFVAAHRAYEQLSWFEATDPATLLRLRSHAQARGPPSFS